ncbi:pyruvate kinase [Clostridium sp. SHJSY1]|uniref:pyruvate kinase n=1 Tax=Clostridium sp. SHJSY1 TaxID=2942483 RepID=UPI0028747546|nr:pyruvate kinase [Clostridium sp. SHJSY1]MDS0524541.1 pyruvate kinase [Clostridium sp. SHJSY1]
MDLICSIGPTVNTLEDIHKYYKAGMTIPRFNFSHVDYDKFDRLILGIKTCYPEMKILQDLQGNKLRVSRIYRKETRVYNGDRVIFCLEKNFFNLVKKEKLEKIKIIPISYEGSLSDLNNAHIIFMKDATMSFKIVEHNKEYIGTITERGGMIRAEKGINAPGMIRDNLKLTNKDKKDILWGIKRGVNIICLSYATSSKDIIEVKEYIKKCKINNNKSNLIKVWAKIECLEGLNNFEEILKISDGIILGRGDLKSEAPIDDIPLIQENLLIRMRKSKKPFVIATYILDSMKKSIIPSLAEINDIYNFTKHKVDGLMLSTEITMAKDPIGLINYLNNLLNKYDEKIKN